MKRYRPAVFVVAYKKEKGKIFYLLLKRKLHWKGWEFPKGGIDFLETKRHCVKRELKEETGLTIKKINKFNFSGKYLYKKPLADRKNVIGQKFSLFSAEVYPGEIKIDEHEHESAEWLDYNNAIKRLTWGNQKEALKIVGEFLR